MKTCPEHNDHRWREQLLDHAAGSPAGAALAEHLASCDICSETLRGLKGQMARIDSEIEQLAASEPSAQAIPRLLANARASQRRAGWLEWKWATAVVAGLAILIAGFIFAGKVRKRGEDKQMLAAASGIAGWRSPTEGLLEFPADRFTANRWLKEPPRLGQYFYQLGGHNHEEERKKP